ncbi:MAG: hypothetical protein NZ729_04715, partial [Methylococcales bacterium]|nr:hypothetical protein [Methylococcales bacterium]
QNTMRTIKLKPNYRRPFESTTRFEKRMTMNRKKLRASKNKVVSRTGDCLLSGNEQHPIQRGSSTPLAPPTITSDHVHLRRHDR